jgi:hypothetical protein
MVMYVTTPTKALTVMKMPNEDLTAEKVPNKGVMQNKFFQLLKITLLALC